MRNRAPSSSDTEPAIGDRHASLREVVLGEIRDAIRSGRFRPGERIAETRLARDFKVSRNPIREALRTLESEGLVEISPRRGASVVAPSARDAAEMIELRAMLEGVNARLAARRRDPAILDSLRSVLELGTEAARAGRVVDVARYNAEFHTLLAAAGQNHMLADLVRSLRDRTSIAFGPPRSGQAARNWMEHAHILEAVIAGDEELASVLASRHTARLGREHLASIAADLAPDRADCIQSTNSAKRTDDVQGVDRGAPNPIPGRRRR
jgi:DNA-binding GntR family transcriptional regulator